MKRKTPTEVEQYANHLADHVICLFSKQAPKVLALAAKRAKEKLTHAYSVSKP